MRKKLLLADDSITIQKVVELTFPAEEFQVVTAGNGRLAVEKAGAFLPDIVLCDIAFGQRNMNGFMFYERFRSMERFSAVPFIFISALNQKELIRTGKKLGVDDYLTKPVENDVLLAAIEGVRRTAIAA